MKKILIAILSLLCFVICASAKDIDLLKVNLNYEQKVIALTLLAEARGEGNLGMYAVACVIQKRSIERKSSVVEVCLQPLQFSCWNGRGSIAAKMDNKKNLFACAQADYAAQLARVLWHNQKLEHKIIGNANHYHTKNVTPKWSKDKTAVAVIGNHKFYKL